MGVLARTFEIKHGIDDVLQGLRSRYRAVFGNVSNEENRHMILFRPEEKLRRNLTDLPNASGRHLEFFAECRLNRIDDHRLRVQIFGSS